MSKITSEKIGVMVSRVKLFFNFLIFVMNQPKETWKRVSGAIGRVFSVNTTANREVEEKNKVSSSNLEPFSNLVGSSYPKNLSSCNGVEFKVDWFAITLPLSLLETVERCVPRIEGSGWEEISPLSEPGYYKAEKCGDVYLHFWQKVGRELIKLVYTGSSDPSSKLCLLKAFLDEGGTLHRIDFSFDDHSNSLTIRKLRSAILDKQYVGKIANHKLIENLSGQGEVGGRTITFGSRASDVYTRFYEKISKEGGANYVRCEMEFKGRAAREVATLIKAHACEGRNPGEVNEDLLQLLRIHATNRLLKTHDFRDRDSNVNVSRAKRVGWWKKFVKEVEVSDEPNGYNLKKAS